MIKMSNSSALNLEHGMLTGRNSLQICLLRFRFQISVSLPLTLALSFRRCHLLCTNSWKDIFIDKTERWIRHADHRQHIKAHTKKRRSQYLIVGFSQQCSSPVFIVYALQTSIRMRTVSNPGLWGPPRHRSSSPEKRNFRSGHLHRSASRYALGTIPMLLV